MARDRTHWAKEFIIGRTDFQLALYIADGVKQGYVEVADVEALLRARADATDLAWRASTATA